MLFMPLPIWNAKVSHVETALDHERSWIVGNQHLNPSMEMDEMVFLILFSYVSARQGFVSVASPYLLVLVSYGFIYSASAIEFSPSVIGMTSAYPDHQLPFSYVAQLKPSQVLECS